MAALLATQAFAEQPTVQGTVAWRFEVLANYISHRADVARDGTVYFNDSSGFLYALTPAGALKWVYDGESVGSAGPTVVGGDGTIYFGLASPDAAVHAVNPDGTRKCSAKANARHDRAGQHQSVVLGLKALLVLLIERCRRGSAGREVAVITAMTVTARAAHLF